MITATDNWKAANAKLAKKPILLINIEGYGRAFSNSSLGAVAGLPQESIVQKVSEVVDFGSAGTFPSALLTPQAVTRGNPLFVFVYNAGSEATSILTIDDSAGNTWTPIYSDLLIVGWHAIANADGVITINISGSDHGFIAGGNFELYALEVSADFAGFHTAGASGIGSPASITAGSTTISFPVNPASGWHMMLIELAPDSGSSLARSLLFFHGFLSGVGGVISGTSEVTGAAAATLYAAVGDATTFPWLLNVDPLSETVSDLDGGSDLSDLVFSVQDRGQAITSDFPSFVFEGKQVILKMGWVGLALADYLTLFTGKIDTVASDNGNQEYKFTCPDIRKDLSKVIFATGDDGFATSSDHPKTLNGHPLDILVNLLQNEVGWSSSIIDIAKIQQWRDTIFSGLTFVFSLTSPPAAKDFIENEIMKPLGAYHRTNNLGVFTVNFFYPINPAPVATLDHDSLTDVPLAEQAALVNQVTFRLDYDSNGKPQVESVQQDGASIKKYGLFGQHMVESAGLRSTFGGSFMAAIVSRLVFLRYGNKQLQFQGAPNLWSECLLESGDIVAVTSSVEPDRNAGVMGITAKSFEILDRQWDPIAGSASFKLLAVDLSKFKPFLFTPNGEADFTAASGTDKGKYLFLSNDAGVYSDSTPANTQC